MLHVVSRYLPEELEFETEQNDDDEEEGDDDDHTEDKAKGGNNTKKEKKPILSLADQRNDGWDNFNHPRYRRALILQELYTRSKIMNIGGSSHKNTNNNNSPTTSIEFHRPTTTTTNNNNDVDNLSMIYGKVHSQGLLDFLSTAWVRWDDMGAADRQDPASSISILKHNNNNNNLMVNDNKDDDDTTTTTTTTTTPVVRHHHRSPPLIPGNVPLHRDYRQRPSANPMGQIGYYCTDTCTPIFGPELLEELQWDGATLEMAVQLVLSAQQKQQQQQHTEEENDNNNNSNACSNSNVAYALCTHPGHHASYDAFGGYCYVNHAAAAARLLQQGLLSSAQSQVVVEDDHEGPPPPPIKPKVAILDVDYHCGNGTASIFHDDPSVLVVSIHCHPDYDYPFHSGFADDDDDDYDYDHETGSSTTNTTNTTTLHLPLQPGTTWQDAYEDTLQVAMTKIVDPDYFGAQALVVSLGLDTHQGDPCAVRRAGFLLHGDDYQHMGALIGRHCKCSSSMPVVVVQEGGYRMDKVPAAAADVLLHLAAAAAAASED